MTLTKKCLLFFLDAFLNGILMIKNNINLTSAKGSLSVSHYLDYIWKQIFTNSYRYSYGLNQVREPLNKDYINFASKNTETFLVFILADKIPLNRF